MQEKNWNKEIELVVQQLTLDEKIGMIHGAGLFQTAGVERLNIPPLRMSDGPMGVRCEFAQTEWKQVGESGDYVTYCPSNTAIASTWNRELARKAGTVLGEEARGRGKDIILGPGINIKRLPVCGRNFEYFSEDPYLISELVVPFIEGIESADVAACVKHFVLNNQETERLWVNVEINERAFREIYLPGFEAAVNKAHVKSVMGAYNLLRGEHCCQSIPLLQGILRDEWEYDGLIISDWGAVHDTRKAAESPLDIEMSVINDFDDYCLA
ncbi:MAG: glycoside hydrolase family 3 protein, partial [Wujia sp.]